MPRKTFVFHLDHYWQTGQLFDLLDEKGYEVEEIIHVSVAVSAYSIIVLRLIAASDTSTLEQDLRQISVSVY